jgi:site-specific DNA recombinase
MANRRNGVSLPTPEAKRCAIYTRKSTAVGLEQEFNSLDAQREACEQYIAARVHEGWRLVADRYDDGGFTGANIERPAFQRLLADVDAGRLDVVVVYKVDRLSRSLLDFAQVMGRFNQAGAAFVSVTQNFSTADAMGRLTLNMLMSFAEFEREMIAERTRDKIAAARKKGKWTGGPVPLGYDVVDRRIELNELEAVIVREVFSLHEQYRSALIVARLLNESGRTTKRHRARNGHLRNGRPWTKDAVLRVLRNPVYAGYIPCHGELHEGEHTAIIDRVRLERVNALLDENAGTKRPSTRNPDYLLRGILRCGLCGKAMTPASTRKTNGTEYRYYRCVTRDKAGRKACNAPPLSADAIERFVIDRLREATADGDLARDVTRKLQQRVEARRKDLATERRELPAKIARLSAEGRNLVETLGQSKGTAHRLLEERIEDVGAELATSEARLAEVERALAEFDRTELDARWVAESLAHFDRVWDVMNADNRVRLVQAIVERVEVNEPGGRVTATLVNLDVGDDTVDDEAGVARLPVPTPAQPNMEAVP